MAQKQICYNPIKHKVLISGQACLYESDESDWTYVAYVLARIEKEIGETSYSYFIRAVDISEKSSNTGCLILDQEIYVPFSVKKRKSFFIYFATEKCHVGLSFLEEEVASEFYAIIKDLNQFEVEEVERSKEEKRQKRIELAQSVAQTVTDITNEIANFTIDPKKKLLAITDNYINNYKKQIRRRSSQCSIDFKKVDRIKNKRRAKSQSDLSVRPVKKLPKSIPELDFEDRKQRKKPLPIMYHENRKNYDEIDFDAPKKGPRAIKYTSEYETSKKKYREKEEEEDLKEREVKKSKNSKARKNSEATIKSKTSKKVQKKKKESDSEEDEESDVSRDSSSSENVRSKNKQKVEKELKRKKNTSAQDNKYIKISEPVSKKSSKKKKQSESEEEKSDSESSRASSPVLSLESKKTYKQKKIDNRPIRNDSLNSVKEETKKSSKSSKKKKKECESEGEMSTHEFSRTSSPTENMSHSARVAESSKRSKKKKKESDSDEEKPESPRAISPKSSKQKNKAENVKDKEDISPSELETSKKSKKSKREKDSEEEKLASESSIASKPKIFTENDEKESLIKDLKENELIKETKKSKPNAEITAENDQLSNENKKNDSEVYELD